ncbi:magnesium ion transporter [Cyanidiococcus yangmingshanensis]|uniref:Magnesium ion transporter n=1 Tax=Cyanidiococcus yangmingshanensis TaxID=2690220 RepID=A0A7J7IIT5_9RHOD|nr:magnesium ion transporter [Cyanidiococcus yangmingshanensis]
MQKIEALRMLKLSSTACWPRPRTVQRALKAVLDEDEDMARLYLTELRKQPGKPRAIEDHEAAEQLLESYLQVVDHVHNRAALLNAATSDTEDLMGIQLGRNAESPAFAGYVCQRHHWLVRLGRCRHWALSYEPAATHLWTEWRERRLVYRRHFCDACLGIGAHRYHVYVDSTLWSMALVTRQQSRCRLCMVESQVSTTEDDVEYANILEDSQTEITN